MALRALYDLPAPAKLNLFLHVVGRRPDGYHLIESIFVLIDWADRLHVERRDDGALARHDLGATLPADDLCLRAARALRDASGTTQGADIHIDKRVPWGAGMGGGSSDAATVLLALNRLWGLDWPRERLAAIGLALGADVPFFIGGRPAFVQGIGERLTPMVLAEATYAVVKPPEAIETRAIFTHPRLRRDSQEVILTGSLEDPAHSAQLVAWAEHAGRNDLQPPAEEVCPPVAEAVRWLQARHGAGRMTGSGSAVFARVGSELSSSGPSSASAVAGMAASPEAMPGGEAFAGLPAGWVGRLCRSLAEHPLRHGARS